MMNRLKVGTSTNEQIEYEESTKNFRIATAKMRLHQNGVESSKISQQAIDKAMRLFDDMDHVQKDVQQKTSKIQQDTESAIQKVNQDANKKFMDIQKRYQDLVNSLKEDKKEIVSENGVQIQIESQEAHVDTVKDTVEEIKIVNETIKEGVREKAHEEKVSEITDAVLKYMRESINERVNEVMNTVDKKVVEIINNPGNEEQAKQIG